MNLHTEYMWHRSDMAGTNTRRYQFHSASQRIRQHTNNCNLQRHPGRCLHSGMELQNNINIIYLIHSYLTKLLHDAMKLTKTYMFCCCNIHDSNGIYMINVKKYHFTNKRKQVSDGFRDNMFQTIISIPGMSKVSITINCSIKG